MNENRKNIELYKTLFKKILEVEDFVECPKTKGNMITMVMNTVVLYEDCLEEIRQISETDLYSTEMQKALEEINFREDDKEEIAQFYNITAEDVIG
jgi:heme oxygenase